VSSVIFTDQKTPDGRTIRYNVDKTTREVAQERNTALQDDGMVEIPNENPDEEPIFVNPERVATISPMKED
jgi:hypothetical protein